MAYKNDYKGIMIDTAIRSYTGKYIEKGKKIYSLLSNISKPKSFDRFIVMAKSCMIFDVYKDLNKIKCPTFIIGGSDDNVLGVDGSILLNKKIKNSKLYIYEGYSHGLYEQAKDFNERVYNYLKVTFFDVYLIDYMEHQSCVLLILIKLVLKNLFLLVFYILH